MADLTHFSFLALSGDLHYLGQVEYGPADFTNTLSEDFEIAAAWEAAGIVAVVEQKDGRDADRLHVPQAIAYDLKAQIRLILAETHDWEPGAVPLVEEPERAATSKIYTFSRDADANWEPADVPVMRSIKASKDSLSKRVASRFLEYCWGVGDCKDYDGFYPLFARYQDTHHGLKGEWGDPTYREVYDERD